jgi:hypothetical protein
LGGERVQQNEGADQKGRLDFFLSYTQSDESWATWIARQLEDAGYTTFSEAWDVRPGMIVLVEKEDALTRADGIILVITSAYLASLAVTLERAAAFNQLLADRHKRVIPIRLDKSVLKGYLGTLACIDLVELAQEQARQRLLEGMQFEKPKPPTVPFPGQQHHISQQPVPSAATVVQTMPATQAGTVQIQLLPSLFIDGLCAGRPLHPDPDHYFVSHGFTPERLMDWRQTITETLAHINHSIQPLKPSFSGDKLLSGYRFCGICERIYSTAFSLFLLPATQDRNVYLELGIAIGLGKPFFLIQDRNAQIPPVLTSLSLYTHSGSFRTMRRELAGQIEEYDFAAVQFTKEAPKQQILPQYLIVAGERFDDLDVEGGVEDALKHAYPQQNLSAFPLSQHLKQTQGFDLRQLVELIQTSRFAVYRVNEDCSPTTFLALGMSIGLSCPFIMISQKGSEIPLNLRGLGIYQFENYTALERDIVKWHQKILDKYMQ